MDIVMIGSGNVAAVLGRKFRDAGHRIVQVISRNAADASALAYEWDTESSNYFSVINKSADVYLLALSDHAISIVAQDLKLPGRVVAHTAGSVSKDALKDVTAHYGVFYPLQSIRKEMNRIPPMPVFYEGSDEKASSVLRKLAESISDTPPVVAGTEDRLKLHVAAVVVSNFSNHLFALAEQFCKQEGIDFRQLLPLIGETAERLKTHTAAETMTGPAVRGDAPTIQKHLDVLKDHPQLQKIYKLMTESIQQSK